MVKKTYKGLSSPIGWVGGKSRLANSINEIIKQVPHKTFVEPFAGGASVYFKKKPAEKSVINDINSKLITFYKQLKNGGNVNKCDLSNAKERFTAAKKRIQNGTGSICDFLLVNKRSMGSSMNQFAWSACSKGNNPSKCGIVNLGKKQDKYKERLNNTKILNKDYRDVIKKYDSTTTLFYHDPPYEGSTSQHYKTDLKTVTPENVAASLKNIKGKTIISFNDSPRVRKAFKGFKILPIKTNYSMNSKSKKNRGKKELIITNFDHKCKFNPKTRKIECPKKK